MSTRRIVIETPDGRERYIVFKKTRIRCDLCKRRINEGDQMAARKAGRKILMFHKQCEYLARFFAGESVT